VRHADAARVLPCGVNEHIELSGFVYRGRAWNIECGFFPKGNFEWALLVEGSNELEDEPALRGGPAVAWRVTKNASLTLEYLCSTCESDLAEDSKGR
jgi:hypothetical protein